MQTSAIWGVGAGIRAGMRCLPWKRGRKKPAARAPVPRSQSSGGFSRKPSQLHQACLLLRSSNSQEQVGVKSSAGTNSHARNGPAFAGTHLGSCWIGARAVAWTNREARGSAAVWGESTN